MIPQNIGIEHILKAIQRIEIEHIPEIRKARKWAICYENKIYPCKLLISWANVYVNGEELNPNPNVFTTNMAKKYLTGLKFKVVEFPFNDKCV